MRLTISAGRYSSFALELGFALSTAGESEGRFREVIQLLERAELTDE
jgi:hypothetical protein